MAKNLDLDEVRKILAQLKKEATKSGLPLARIRDIDDIEKTIKLLEKNRGK